MRSILAALTLPLLLAPSVLGAPAVAYQGALGIACVGVTYHVPEAEAGWAGNNCGAVRSFDAVGTTGRYEATFAWDATPGYETLRVCVETWVTVADLTGLGAGRVVQRVEESCAVGASPLAVSVPASPEDVHVDILAAVVTPDEPLRVWAYPPEYVSVSYVVTHDPDA